MKALHTFEIVYALIALNFIIPAVSYVVAPEMAEETMGQINALLGGGAWPTEQGQLWHMLAVGNVMTLGFMCLLLMFDLERFYSVLPALAFLKAFSALYSLMLGAVQGLPAFYAVFVLDGSTTLAMVFFAVRAHRELERLAADLGAGHRPAPLWARLLLLRPAAVQARLDVARRRGLAPAELNLEGVARGVLRMMARVVFRSETVGTSSRPVRGGWRARALAFRAVRLPFLLVERAIAPLDLSGLLSSPERITRHLLGAFHDEEQMLYDFELLQLHAPDDDPDLWIRKLEARARAIVDGEDPRTAWLRDLVVFEGYHEHLLELVERWLAAPLPPDPDPDISLAAFLRWCACASSKPHGRASFAQGFPLEGPLGQVAPASRSRLREPHSGMLERRQPAEA